VPKTLPLRQRLPLEHQDTARRAGRVFSVAVLAEGAWAFFGSLVLGLGQRDHPAAIPQAPWIWLAGATLIAGLAWGLARNAASPDL
jgi:hypothetical protein